VKDQKDQFGYDAEKYSWLKGVIEFNPKRQVWHLTYSQAPDDNDPCGGEVTLKNTAHFKYLRSGEIVRVEGQFDEQQVDQLGKPVYEVVRMIRDVKR
jgi:N-acetylneuraminic acid mutarotase